MGLVALALASAEGAAAPAAPPRNVAEPEIDGRAEQGRALAASRGRWAGSDAIAYEFRWVRCGVTEEDLTAATAG